MAKTAAPLMIPIEDQICLRGWESAHSTPQQVVLRCRMLLGASEGKTNQELAAQLDQEPGGPNDGAEPAQHPASDWARLELAEAVPPAIEPLRLSKEFPLPGTAVALPGYNQDRIHQLMADTSCRITGISMIRGERLLTHDCSATRGTSGGPLLARRGDHWEAIGINIAVTASANLALPVTDLPEVR